MFIKRLIVENTTEIIREINFTNGLNLILDDTPSDDTKSTGNNVGKTTVLKLIDFCLGSNPNIIFTDTENKRIFNRRANYYYAHFNRRFWCS